jgi:hypothetical protein
LDDYLPSSLTPSAYVEACTLLENLPASVGLGEFFGSSSKSHSSYDKETNTYTYHKHYTLFPALCLQILNESVSPAVGWHYFTNLIQHYLHPPFDEAILEAVRLVESQDIPGLLEGIAPYMFKSHFNVNQWQPLDPETRTIPLMMRTESLPEISFTFVDFLNFELGVYCPTPSTLWGDCENPRLMVDIEPFDYGGRGLIHVLAFLPDFIIAEGVALLGINGLKMLWYLQQCPKTCDIPFSIMTANSPVYYRGFEIEMYNKARFFIPKPFEFGFWFACVSQHLSEFELEDDTSEDEETDFCELR